MSESQESQENEESGGIAESDESDGIAGIGPGPGHQLSHLRSGNNLVRFRQKVTKWRFLPKWRFRQKVQKVTFWPDSVKKVRPLYCLSRCSEKVVKDQESPEPPLLLLFVTFAILSLLSLSSLSRFCHLWDHFYQR